MSGNHNHGGRRKDKVDCWMVEVWQTIVRFTSPACVAMSCCLDWAPTVLASVLASSVAS